MWPRPKRPWTSQMPSLRHRTNKEDEALKASTRRLWLARLATTIIIVAIALQFVPFQSTAASDDAIEITLVGDVMLGRNVGDLIDQQGSSYPFTETKDHLSSSDITFCNLENPVTDEDTPFLQKTYQFKADPSTVNGLVWAGFDVVSLANNHIMDYGPTGANDSITNLEDSGLHHVGLWHGQDAAVDAIQRPMIINSSGTKVGFLAYTEAIPSSVEGSIDQAGPCPLDPTLMEADITYAKDQVDILMVSIHWVYQPQYDYRQLLRQEELSKDVIDWGANVVIGHGPHVVQDIIGYHDGLIFYSLGNFVFDIRETQSYLERYDELPYNTSDEMNEKILSSVIAKVEMKGSEIVTLSLTPVNSDYTTVDDLLGGVKYKPRVVGETKVYDVYNGLEITEGDIEDGSGHEGPRPAWHVVLSIIVLVVSVAVNVFILYMVLIWKPNPDKPSLIKKLLYE